MLSDMKSLFALGCFGLISVILASLALDALFAFIIMLFWNWLVPILWVGAPVLGYWETFGLLVLFNIIIGLIKAK